MIDATPAARLLLVEAAALEPLLRRSAAEAFAAPTVCDGWSVRDVVAHCSGLLARVTAGESPGCSPGKHAENQADVEARRGWPLDRLVDELIGGYHTAAPVVSRSDGRLDSVALAGWLHGGDIRHALHAPDPYTSPGVELALELLVARSSPLPAVLADLPDRMLHLGGTDPDGGASPARLVTDIETLVRLLTGRRPDPARYDVDDPHLDPVRLELELCRR